MSATEIIENGEKLVKAWLKSNGFFRINTLREGGNHIDIEADGKISRIIVHLTIEKGQEFLLEGFQEQEIYKHVNREPWVATLHVNKNGELDETILWKRIAAGA